MAGKAACWQADHTPDARGWTVGLADPLRPERRLAEIHLRDRALATSGASHQFFRSQGKRYGHILDPRDGMAGRRSIFVDRAGAFGGRG